MSDEAINHFGHNNNTALIWAVKNKLEKICEILIPKMSDDAMNKFNNKGETVLFEATSTGLEKVCIMLFDRRPVKEYEVR